MAAIFNDVVITYAGKEYTVKPTFALINKIEQPQSSGGLGISLAAFAARSSRGEVAITEAARVLAFLLNSEGSKEARSVTADDMYVEMMADNAMVQHYIAMVVGSFFPVIPDRVAKTDNADDEAKKKE